MLRRLVLLTTSGAVALALTGPVTQPAVGDTAPPDPATTLTGWTGDSPRPVAMTIASSGRATAVFTTEHATGGGDGATVWVASRPDGGLGHGPRQRQGHRPTGGEQDKSTQHGSPGPRCVRRVSPGLVARNTYGIESLPDDAVPAHSTGRPRPRAISIRCTSEVPSPISSTLASR